MIDIRQTLQYAKYLSLEGWTVERIKKTNYFIKKIPLFGSVLKVPRPEKIQINTINKLAQKYRSFQIIVEPKNKKDAQFLTSFGFKISKYPYLPTKTLQIDLTKNLNLIFQDLKKDTRRAIKKGIKQTIKVYTSPDEIKNWRKAWKKSVNYQRFVPSEQSLINLSKSFTLNKSLFIASHNMSGKIICGAVFTLSLHNIAYYWYGFTNKEGRASLSQYSLLFYGILWAKNQGCKIFDFEGIYDPRFPNKSWLGFTRFKRSFGGYEVEYPGCYTKFRFPYAKN